MNLPSRDPMIFLQIFTLLHWLIENHYDLDSEKQRSSPFHRRSFTTKIKGEQTLDNFDHKVARNVSQKNIRASPLQLALIDRFPRNSASSFVRDFFHHSLPRGIISRNYILSWIKTKLPGYWLCFPAVFLLLSSIKQTDVIYFSACFPAFAATPLYRRNIT